MKPILVLFGMFSFYCTGALAQSNIQRDHVLVETFVGVSGNQSFFSSGVMLGANDLVENGQHVSVIGWHIGDSLQTAESLDREAYYPITAYPTTVFDGLDQYVGGDPSNSLYTTFLPYYNAAIGVSTPLDLESTLLIDSIGIHVQAIISLVASLPMGMDSLDLYIVLTESHIPVSWTGPSEINFIERYAHVEVLALTVGTNDTLSHTIQMDPSWNMNHLEAVVFIQDSASQTVLNSVSESIHLNASIRESDVKIDVIQCSDRDIEPSFILENNGKDSLMSVNIEFAVNGEMPQVINWTGTLASGESELLTLPVLSFTQQPSNFLQVQLNHPNGQSDQILVDDTLKAEWTYPVSYAGEYTLELKPDIFGSEISWEVLDPTGALVMSGGPYMDGNTDLITANMDLGTYRGCHEFRIYDSGGDGLTSLFSGYYSFEDPSGNLIITSLDGTYGAEDGGYFQVDYPISIASLNPEVIQVFPNPTMGQVNIRIEQLSEKLAEIGLYTINGIQVYGAVVAEEVHQIDLRVHPAGMYIIKIKTDQEQHVEKIAKW